MMGESQGHRGDVGIALEAADCFGVIGGKASLMILALGITRRLWIALSPSHFVLCSIGKLWAAMLSQWSLMVTA